MHTRVDGRSVQRDGPTTNLSLLDKTQAYIRARLEIKIPDTVVTSAWDELYRVYSDMVRRFVHGYCLQDSDINDSLQEVWSAVYAHLADFEHPRTRPGLRAWFYTLVRSKAVDLIRRKQRQPALQLDEVPEPSLRSHSSCIDADTELEKQWEKAVVTALLRELRAQVSDLNYRVLFLRLVEGQDTKSVAEVLAIARERVRYRLHRMLKKLRALLEVYNGDSIGGLKDRLADQLKDLFMTAFTS